MAGSKVSAARWAALEILCRVDEGYFSSGLLAEVESRLEPADRALCHELVLGSLRWQLTLDRIIEHYSRRKIESLDLPVLIALRLGIYQLRYLTRIPASAAVDESVKLVKTARLSSAGGFVNAILRRAVREPEYDPAANVSDPVVRISLKTSHPAWLIERWVESFGLTETKALAVANNQNAVVAFRVVRPAENKDKVLERLRSAGAAAVPSELVADCWRVESASGVLRELAARGLIYVQDEASQLVAEVVCSVRSKRILDLCAAPGSKTTLIAARDDNALVIASDVSSRRLETLSSAVKAQLLSRVELVLLDAKQTLPFKSGSFDTVLVDAPCSGTGTLRHNPEIRWRITADDISRLAAQQLQILRNAASAVKPGGRLIYSTCSLEEEENEAVVEAFTASTQGLVPIFLESGKAFQTKSGALRTWPHHHETDGFFITAMTKV